MQASSELALPNRFCIIYCQTRLPPHLNIPPTSPLQQVLMASIAMLAGLILFVGIERITTPYYAWATDWDALIPFLAWTWGVYVLFFPFILWACWQAPPTLFWHGTQASGLAFVIGCVCFICFPEVIPRPDITQVTPEFLRVRISKMWMLDSASNGCPSLHITLTLLAMRMIWSSASCIGQRWLMMFVGGLICISTLTFKQHTLIDVGGGFALAVFAWYLTQSDAWSSLRH